MVFIEHNKCQASIKGTPTYRICIHPAHVCITHLLAACTTQAVSKLEAQVEALQQELDHERALQAQQEGMSIKAQVDLEVQLAVSRASEKALQQVSSCGKQATFCAVWQMLLVTEQQPLLAFKDVMRSVVWQLVLPLVVCLHH